MAVGNWATTAVWGRVHKIGSDRLNSYLLESTLNFLRRDYAFTRMELVDKDELFPHAAVHPVYRIGAYTFGGVHDLVQNHAWQLGLGADVTVYSKPAVLDALRELSRVISDFLSGAAGSARAWTASLVCVVG